MSRRNVCGITINCDGDSKAFYTGKRRTSGCRVHSQHLNELRHLTQMVQCIAGGLVVAAQEVNVKNILPRAAAHGPRLNLAQANIPQREHTERLEERPRHIAHLKSDRSLIRPAGNEVVIIDSSLLADAASPATQLADQKESCEIPLVVFNVSLKNFPGILPRRLPSRNSRRIFQSFRNHEI